jgi:hypothetical protein
MPRIDSLGLPIGKLKDPGKPDRRRLHVENGINQR